MPRLVLRPRVAPDPSSAERSRVEALARRLLDAKPELALEERFRPLALREWLDAPALQLDDQSAIPAPELGYDTSHLQDRARLRALDCDRVVSHHEPPEGYEEYCRTYLGLGRVEWLTPGARRFRRQLASHCWSDRAVRRQLTRAVRVEGLRYLHPLMGSRAVWELGLLLQRSTRRPISVLAPPPSLTSFVNDKTEFARTAHALFGPSALPRTEAANCLARIAAAVRSLSSDHAQIGLKLPDAAGGGGNLVLSAKPYRGRDLDEVARRLRPLLAQIGWSSGSKLLVSAWEEQVLCAPSVQTWIPPEPDRDVVVDGVFEQKLENTNGEFVGTMPAELPEALEQALVTRSGLLATLYQRLGYVGRCSFDLVVAGKSLEDASVGLIECNGRWGGTSLPMTLMDRLFPRDPLPGYVVHNVTQRGLSRVDFRALLEHFEEDLFDERTGRGHLIFFDPARMQARSSLSFISIAPTRAEALDRARDEVPKRLAPLTRWRCAPLRTALV